MAEPVACTLRPGELSARQAELLPGLMASGYRLTFPADTDTLVQIVRAIDAERQCCRFLEFHLMVAPAGGPFTLDVNGPEGTREFLDQFAIL
jgi:hypothetical protein